MVGLVEAPARAAVATQISSSSGSIDASRGTAGGSVNKPLPAPAASQQPVQDEWREVLDKKTKHVYYWNPRTNEVSWTRPTATPAAQAAAATPTAQASTTPCVQAEAKRKDNGRASQVKSLDERITRFLGELGIIERLCADITESGSGDAEDDDDSKERIAALFVGCYDALGRLGPNSDMLFAFDTKVKLQTREADWHAGQLSGAYLQERLMKIRKAVEKKCQVASSSTDATEDTAASAALAQVSPASQPAGNLAVAQASLLARISSSPLFSQG